jgi:hypothetical protein
MRTTRSALLSRRNPEINCETDHLGQIVHFLDNLSVPCRLCRVYIVRAVSRSPVAMAHGI